MYLLVAKPFTDTLTGYYLIGNEILTCMYLVIIALPYPTTSNISQVTVRNYCIIVITAALALNLLTNLVTSVSSLIKLVRERRRKVKQTIVPAIDTEYRITSMVEFENKRNNLKPPAQEADLHLIILSEAQN